MNKKIKKIISWFNNKGLIFISDEDYIKLAFKIKLNRKLDLNNPVTFDEKLQWLKLYDRRSIYTMFVDKYEVKDYVKNVIGEEYIIPTLGVYDKFDDIDFEKLPNSFVIKCNHDSGGLVICNDKSKLDINKAKSKINKSLRVNYYKCGREWPYKNVKPRIIVEELLESKEPLTEYKFYCFNGEPKYLWIAAGEAHTPNRCGGFLNLDYTKTDIKRKDIKELTDDIKKPKNYEKMVEIARQLSKGYPFLRIDLYNVDGNIKFGEITIYSGSGFIPFSDYESDLKLGKCLDITKVLKNRK